MEPQVEDRADLHFRQLVDFARNLRVDRFDQTDIMGNLADGPFARQQLFTGFGGTGRTPNDLDHLIKVGDRDDQAEQDMRTLTRLVQFELGAAGNDLFAELHKGFDNLAQAQQFGPTAANGEHVGGETRLRGRVAPQLIQHDFGRRVALQVHDDPYAFAAGFVADVADAFDPLFLGGLGDLFNEAILADLIGDGGQDDRLAIAASFLDHIARAHHDRAAAGMIGRLRARLAQDQRGGGEIGAGDDGDQFVGGDARIVDIGKAGAQHFAEVMRRDVGRHADRNAASAIDEQIGEARGQNLRLMFRRIIVGREIDRILVEIFEQRTGNLGEARFSIAHRGWRIGVHRAEIALTIDQRHAHRPVLRHPRQGVVNRTVAMRVIFTHHLADEARGLTIGAVVEEARFLGGKENAAMNRLQPVAHVRQGARNDDGHGIVEIAGLHLLDDGDGADVRRVGEDSLVGQCDSLFR